jgi:DNA (cytosine-5)-methyltransferase 1
MTAPSPHPGPVTVRARNDHQREVMGGWGVLSLFSGIGGLDLGLARAGMRIVGQVERDPCCRAVLARHWPQVPRHDDVRTALGWWGSRARPAVRVVAGGFPCQPFSGAGRRRGVADERWGWPWMADVVRELRPGYVVVENVPGLVRDSEAFGWLLGDLHTLGFDADWSVVPACAVGAPHTRSRVFLVAHTHRGDGTLRLGPGPGRAETIPGLHDRAGAWRDRVAGALAASRGDDRETDGSARRLVTAGGNAVVPQVAEHIGRLITTHSRHPDNHTADKPAAVAESDEQSEEVAR